MMRYFEANPTVALRVEARRRMWKNMMQQTNWKLRNWKPWDDLFKGKAGDQKFIMGGAGKNKSNNYRLISGDVRL